MPAISNNLDVEFHVISSLCADCYAGACLNGGTCLDGLASYTCSCINGYTGSICQTAPGVTTAPGATTAAATTALATTAPGATTATATTTAPATTTPATTTPATTPTPLTDAQLR
jgi:Notch-like protein